MVRSINAAAGGTADDRGAIASLHGPALRESASVRGGAEELSAAVSREAGVIAIRDRNGNRDRTRVRGAAADMTAIAGAVIPVSAPALLDLGHESEVLLIFGLQLQEIFFGVNGERIGGVGGDFGRSHGCESDKGRADDECFLGHRVLLFIGFGVRMKRVFS